MRLSEEAMNMKYIVQSAVKKNSKEYKPMPIPNFRNKEEREPYRNDNATTNPIVAGDQVWPAQHPGTVVEPDEVYENVRNIWLAGKDAE